MTSSPWPYFSMEELSCHCCGEMKMNADYMDKVVKFRQFYGPLSPNSAYRCEKHDREVGTSSTPGSGPHTLGRAIDFKIRASEGKKFMETVLKLGFFTGYGLDLRQSVKDDLHFIHCDDLREGEFIEHPRPGLWTYP